VSQSLFSLAVGDSSVSRCSGWPHQEIIPLNPSPRTFSISPGIVIVLILAVVVPSIASGQTKTQATPPVMITGTPAKTEKLSDLTARYRFFEKFTTSDESASAGVAGTSKIAIIEVVKESIEIAKAAPKVTETTRHSIFIERPFEINAVNNVNSILRSYQGFKIKGGEAHGMDGQPLEGLTVLIRPRLADLPQILSLTEARPLNEVEYGIIAHQMFIPQISQLLPGQVVRIGDNWKINRRASQALLADPFLVGEGLLGELTEIRKEVDGPRLVAVIAITGKLATPMGDCSINAELLFTFLGESSLKSFSTKPSFPPRPSEDIINCRGSITEIRLGSLTSGFLPGNGRLRFHLNRSVTMHRLIGLPEGAEPLPRLKQIPEPTDANSWLTFTAPNYKYSFQHPQDLLSLERNLALPEPKNSFMTRATREGRDILQIELLPGNFTPEDLKKEMAEKYKALTEKFRQIGSNVIKGEEVWLPEKEWPATMKVHRIDSEVKLVDPKAKSVSAGKDRIHFDGYLILNGQNSTIVAIASTTRDSVGPYRKEIEQILRSIRLDPPRPALK
jgi:hypothetical protein